MQRPCTPTIDGFRLFVNGQLETRWRTGQDCAIDLVLRMREIEWRVGLHAALGIRTTDNRPVAYLASTLTMPPCREVRTNASLRCTVPRLPLEPGNYSLNIELYDGEDVILRQPAFMRLEVAEGHFYDSGLWHAYGGVLIDQDWKWYDERPQLDATRTDRNDTVHRDWRGS